MVSFINRFEFSVLSEKNIEIPYQTVRNSLIDVPLNDSNTEVSKLPICISVYYFDNMPFAVFSEAF